MCGLTVSHAVCEYNRSYGILEAVMWKGKLRHVVWRGPCDFEEVRVCHEMKKKGEKYHQQWCVSYVGPMSEPVISSSNKVLSNLFSRCCSDTRDQSHAQSICHRSQTIRHNIWNKHVHINWKTDENTQCNSNEHEYNCIVIYEFYSFHLYCMTLCIFILNSLLQYKSTIVASLPYMVISTSTSKH